MRRPRLHLFLTGLLLAASLPAAAAYRCETNGKITYSDAPCLGGQRLEIQSVPVTADGERRAALEKKQLEEIEQAAARRKKAEQKEQQRAARATAAERRRCEKLALRSKWAAQDAADAKGKAIEKSRRKALRVEEQYQAECGNKGAKRNGLVGIAPA